MNRIQKLVYEIEDESFDYLQIHTGLNQFCIKYNLSNLADSAYDLIKEMLFEHLKGIRPLTFRITHAELSGETALDFMVEKMETTPLSDEQRRTLAGKCKQVVEEPTARGFRVKLII